MISDKLDNIGYYNNIPDFVRKFVKTLKPEMPLGKVILESNAYANIEKYDTKMAESGRFESHKKYIDIQILLTGNERIYYTDKANLSVSELYDAQKDIEFYSDKISGSDFITLDGTNFVLLYPHEAHAPQIQTKSSETVKKVVIKLPV